MPPKKNKKAQEAASKKALQKKKNQIIEDKTFGLKNKNKSKKVQQHIQSVQKSVMNTGDRKQRQLEEARKQQKAQAKLLRKQKEEEQNALFGEALLAVQKKTKINQKDGKVEAKGRDADDGKKSGTSRAMKMMYQMDAQEVQDRLKEDPNYVPTLEDEIEAERQRKVAELKKSGKGTPVTEESFHQWRLAKQKKRAAEAKKLVESELRKKKGGKGLAVLSGRDLYEYKQELFKDLDDDALMEDEDNDKKMSASDVDHVASKVQEDLFLEEEDDDLDGLESDDE